MSRRIFPLIFVLCSWGCGAKEQSKAQPPVEERPVELPVFEIALWPGEGIPVLEGAQDSLLLYREPLVRSAPAGTLTTAKGRSLPYDSTRYQTIASARAVALEATQLHGRDFGNVRFLTRDAYTRSLEARSVNLAPGDTVEYLQARAEGTCFVRAAGSVWEVDSCIVFDSSKFSLSGEPATRWWVHVTQDGTTGWLVVSDSTAKVVRRTF